MVAAFEYLLQNLVRLEQRTRELAAKNDFVDPTYGQKITSLEAKLLCELSRKLAAEMNASYRMKQ